MRKNFFFHQKNNNRENAEAFKNHLVSMSKFFNEEVLEEHGK